MALTGRNRIMAAIANVRPRIDALPQEKRDEMEGYLSITMVEHFAYQEQQAMAHVAERISTEEAQTVYMALGEQGAAANGGWAEGTDVATKVVVTQLMEELMRARRAAA